MEEKVSIDSLLNRRARLEREKAMNAARCPKESKFGECLLNMRTKEDPVLCRSLRKLNSEYKRLELQMKQLRESFVKQSRFLNHEPLILVERPASPDVRRRKVIMDSGADDPERLKLPGYMRPLKTRSRTPSTITTIDAFTLNTKKKRNVWEEAMDERSETTFKSTVRPCAKLTLREVKEIQLGWISHRPRLEGARRSPSPSRTTCTPRSMPNDYEVFITELPKTEERRSVKTVRFRDTGLENISLPVSPDCRSMSRSNKQLSRAYSR